MKRKGSESSFMECRRGRAVRNDAVLVELVGDLPRNG